MQMDPMREQMSPALDYYGQMTSPRQGLSGSRDNSPYRQGSPLPEQRVRLLQRNQPLRAVPHRGLGSDRFTNNSMLRGRSGGGVPVVRTVQQDPSNLNSPSGRKGSMSTDNTRTPSTNQTPRYYSASSGSRSTPGSGNSGRYSSSSPSNRYQNTSRRGFK